MTSTPLAPPRRRHRRGLAVAAGGLRVVVDAARAAPRPRPSSCASGSSTTHGAHGPRLRRRAREADAPDRRPPRPHRLPAPAPDARAPTAPGRRRVRLDDAGSYRVFADFSHDGRRRRRSPATCASTAPPTCGRCPRRSPTAVERRRLRRPARRGQRRAGGGRPALHRHPRRPAGRRPSPTSARAATSSRCARATWRSCTSTRPDAAATRSASRSSSRRPGRYRLFLQFKVDGRVHTAAFTQRGAA